MKQGMLLEGKYQIFEEIKHSSTGEVYLARAGNKYYAVKAVHRSDAALPTVLYTAQHPGLPHLEEVLEKGDEVIFIMDWISGSTLDQCLKETGVQPETLVLNWAVQLCDVLLYLHSLPVVHCDIKPSNILLRPDGRLVLIDLSAATTPGTQRDTGFCSTGTIHRICRCKDRYLCTWADLAGAFDRRHSGKYGTANGTQSCMQRDFCTDHPEMRTAPAR